MDDAGTKAEGTGTAVERAREAIRLLIVRGEFAPGDRLKEEDLASRTGASRTPVREALGRLAAEGLVEIISNRGAFVSKWSDADLGEIFELRALLEGYAAFLAAGRITDQQLEEAAALAREMRDLSASDDAEAFDQIALLNNRFHTLLLGASHNVRLQTMLMGLVQVPLVHRTFHRYRPEDIARSNDQHDEIVSALRSRDPDWAASVVRSHVYAARHSIFHLDS